MSEAQNQTSILKIFAARAGSEIERLKAEQKLRETLESANFQLQKQLKESEERFRDLFEEAPIAYVHEGLDSKFIRANRAALKSLGLKPEDVTTMFGKALVVDNPENQKRFSDANFEYGKLTELTGIYYNKPVPLLKVYDKNREADTIPLIGYGKHGVESAIEETEKGKKTVPQRKRDNTERNIIAQ